MGKYCRSCGNQVSSLDNFCGGCGQPLKDGVKKQTSIAANQNIEDNKELEDVDFELDRSSVKVEGARARNQISFKNLVQSVANSDAPPETFTRPRKSDKLYSKDKSEFIANLMKDNAPVKGKSKDVNGN